MDLYRYSVTTRQEFLAIMGSDAMRSRIWLPNQAALEYQRNRLKVIGSQRAAYKQIRDGLDEALEGINRKVFSGFKKHESIKVDDLYREVEESLNAIKQRLEEQENAHPDFSETDPIRKEIDRLFEEKIGDAYSAERLKQIYKEGGERYGQEPKTPPGFEDTKSKKGNDQYGDLLIWFQIIDKAKAENKPIIFVTDDRKEDWWWKSDGKTLGPRPELVQEIAEKASVPFYMYQADRFLEFAKEFLNQDIEQSTIDEIKQLREERETKEIEAQAAIRATSSMLAEAVVEKASEEGLRSSSLELQARPVSFADVADAWRFWSDPENQKAVKN